MKVALWAEIRRLAEIEKLSGRVIARRLHCSRHTVAAALEMQQPPAGQALRRASLLDPYLDQIKDLLAKYPAAVRQPSRRGQACREEKVAEGARLGNATPAGPGPAVCGEQN
jgi:hypothetical protein